MNHLESTHFSDNNLPVFFNPLPCFHFFVEALLGAESTYDYDRLVIV